MAKDKWKTFPCRNCLLKKSCGDRCFEIPVGSLNHVKENKLQGICLACGNVVNKSNVIVWYCANCNVNICFSNIIL